MTNKIPKHSQTPRKLIGMKSNENSNSDILKDKVTHNKIPQEIEEEIIKSIPEISDERFWIYGLLELKRAIQLSYEAGQKQSEDAFKEIIEDLIKKRQSGEKYDFSDYEEKFTINDFKYILSKIGEEKQDDTRRTD